MTPEERQLITGLFDRMRGFALAEKDGEAEALINEQRAGVKDAPYMLVQSVLMQEQALQQAERRIKELEEQVRALQSAAEQRPRDREASWAGCSAGGRPSPRAGLPRPWQRPRRRRARHAFGLRRPPGLDGAAGLRRSRACSLRRPRSSPPAAVPALGHGHRGRCRRRHAGRGRDQQHARRQQRPCSHPPSADAGSGASSASGKETAEPQAQPQEASHQEAG